MSNIYLEYMKERVDKYGIDKMVFTDTETALLAIAVELQTLNETLKYALQDSAGHEAPLSHLIWAALTEWEPPFGT